MTRIYLVVDAVTVADPRVDTRNLLRQTMWAKAALEAKVFVLARRRAFELSAQAELEARAAGVPHWEHYASDAFARGFRPIRELAYDENAWALAFLADRVFDFGGPVWPTRAWKHAARGEAPIVLLRRGALTADEQRQVEDVNRGDRRPFEVIDPSKTDLLASLPRILNRTRPTQ